MFSFRSRNAVTKMKMMSSIMRRYLVFGFVFWNLTYISPVNSYEMEIIPNLVADTSKALFIPSAAISILLCTETENEVIFSRVLSEKQILHNFLNFDYFKEDEFPFHKTAILVDLDCPEASNFLKMANKTGIFSGPLKWLFLRDSRNPRKECLGDCLLDDFKDFAMYPDSEVIVLRRLDENNAEILSIYRPSPVRDMIVEDRGLWSYDTGITLKDTHVASRRRRNVHRTQLKSSIVVTKPGTPNHLTDYHDKHLDTIAKCNFIWLHHIAGAMNATVSYDLVDSWGYQQQNGSWTGMMKPLSRKEDDIGGTAMFMTAKRWEYVHFIPLSTPTGIYFIFRQPPLSSVSNLFVLPFHRAVWVAIAVLLSLILILLIIVTKWEWTRRNLDRTDQPLPTLSDQLVLVAAACTEQGFTYYPKTVPSRIVLMMLLLAIMSLYASYSANIVALLQSTTKSIKTVKDLLDSPINCGAEDIVYNRHYLKIEREPIRRALIDKKIQPNTAKSTMMTAEEGIARVRHGFFAFYIEIGPGYNLIQQTFEENEKCGLQDMSFIEQSDPTFAIAKQSPYREIIRVAALKIEESGLKSKEVSRFYTKRPTCSGRGKFVSVGISECYFLFYVQGYGMLIALLILVLEILWSKSACILRLDKRRASLSRRNSSQSSQSTQQSDD